MARRPAGIGERIVKSISPERTARGLTREQLAESSGLNKKR